MKTEPWTTAEIIADIEKIIRHLSVVNRVGVVWPSPERVVLELRDLKPPPTNAEIARPVDAITDKAGASGDRSRTRWLRSWRLGP